MRFLVASWQWVVMTVQDAGYRWLAFWAVAGAVLGFAIGGWQGAVGLAILCPWALIVYTVRDNALDWAFRRQDARKAERAAKRRAAREAERPDVLPWWKQDDE